MKKAPQKINRKVLAKMVGESIAELLMARTRVELREAKRKAIRTMRGIGMGGGAGIRLYRDLRHVSQLDLCLKTGINCTKISNIENGYVEPTEEEKQRLAEVLGVAVKDVFPTAR